MSADHGTSTNIKFGALNYASACIRFGATMSTKKTTKFYLNCIYSSFIHHGHFLSYCWCKGMLVWWSNKCHEKKKKKNNACTNLHSFIHSFTHTQTRMLQCPTNDDNKPTSTNNIEFKSVRHSVGRRSRKNLSMESKAYTFHQIYFVKIVKQHTVFSCFSEKLLPLNECVCLCVRCVKDYPTAFGIQMIELCESEETEERRKKHPTKQRRMGNEWQLPGWMR